MRPAHRIPMPDLDRILRETNALLEEANLSRCTSLQPVDDGDSNNPTLIGHSPSRLYVIKAVFGGPHRGAPLPLIDQYHTANWFKDHRDLPIPRHLCHAREQNGLPLMIMEWMPGDQLRLALPLLSKEGGEKVARDWGRYLARLHMTQVPR